MHLKILMMRFSLIILLCCLTLSIVTARETLSQEKKEDNIFLSFTNASVISIIEALSRQTGYSFFYDESNLSQMDHINIRMEGANIKQVLDQISKQTLLRFYKVNDTYTVVPPFETNKVSSIQQGIRVTGTVSDNNGDLVPGVNVVIRSTTLGTTTDSNGEFTINVPSDTCVLQFRFIGYQSQEVVVGNRKIIAVTLQEAAAEIGEVVVVAFGKQKKESVIGSISTINPAELKIPSSNLTAAFAGQMAGVIAYQRSGEPGADNADFFVRGITTFGNNTIPLILIDGIELTSTDLARLQPDDIASFSVMKDATATALYGARGANGVILVTTKQGTEGPAKVSIRLENSWSMPTRNVELADPVTYMRLENEAVKTRKPENTQVYSDEKIADTESGRDPIRFPANDWMDMLFKKYTMNQRANMNVSGGGSIARYYVAGSFSHDNGMLKVDKRQNFNSNINNKSFTLRSNVNLDITKLTELTVRLNGAFDDYSGPITGGEDMYYMIMRSNPVMFPAYYPTTPETAHINHIMFGNYDNSYLNPYAESVKGYKDKNRSQILAQLEVKQDLGFLTEGLSIRGMLNVSRLSQFSVNRFYNPYFYQISSYNYQTGAYTLRNTNENSATDYLGYTEPSSDKVTNSTFYFEGMVNYNRTFAEKHTVSGLLVYIARQSLNANTASLQLSLPSRNIGLSGRVTYSYDNRYSGEVNFGYNGSERFSESHRFGFFPSMGLAWNISNEQFWESFKPVVSNLKLRYSYGLVGNDQIGTAADRFYYLSEMNMNDGGKWMQFGRDLNYRSNGISVTRYANSDITWETSAKQNYAIEIGLWNKLTLITEYFREHRYNILMTRSSIPLTMGLADRSRVRANVGEAKGSGLDLSLEYQQNWTTDFWTSARGNFTYATSEYLVYEEPAYEESWREHKGKSLKQEWGYIAERLFVDDAEAENSPSQEISSYKYGGGDIKYTDVNGDGRITEIDRVPIGNPTVPEIVYGFGVSMGYKGFDASVFFQGAANESFWIDAGTIQPFVNQHNLLKVIADDHWSEEQRNLYAFWPRLNQDSNGNNLQQSTWWMRDGSFLRLKQAEIGYSIPGSWKNRLHISNLRLYVSGTNLLLWSKFKLWDVEMAGNGLGYPIQRVFNVGLNVSFN